MKTPSGKPDSSKSSARRTDTEGSRSEGFSTTAFPLARALALIHNGTMIGKLKGVTAATTPTASRVECTSTPSATWSENSPFRCSISPQAYSTFSSPRAISPLASASVLPCSLVISAASSSVCSTRSWRSVNRTLVRRDSDDWDHSRDAARDGDHVVDELGARDGHLRDDLTRRG